MPDFRACHSSTFLSLPSSGHERIVSRSTRTIQLLESMRAECRHIRSRDGKCPLSSTVKWAWRSPWILKALREMGNQCPRDTVSLVSSGMSAGPSISRSRTPACDHWTRALILAG